VSQAAWQTVCARFGQYALAEQRRVRRQVSGGAE
jgi:hypothetical protein